MHPDITHGYSTCAQVRVLVRPGALTWPCSDMSHVSMSILLLVQTRRSSDPSLVTVAPYVMHKKAPRTGLFKAAVGAWCST